MLAGAILRGRRAGLALVVLLVVGLPMSPGGRGGLGMLLDPSGEFILAWPIGAYVVGKLTEKTWRRD